MSSSNMAEYMAKRRRNRKEKLFELANKLCKACGETDVSKFEFDHRNPKEKKFLLSGSDLDKPWNNILEEFSKCDLLCHNCHRKKTIENNEVGGGWNRVINPKHGTSILYMKQKCRCDECRLWRVLYRKKYVDSQGNLLVDKELLKDVALVKKYSKAVHGSDVMYRYHKCRCNICRVENAASRRRQRFNKSLKREVNNVQEDC